MPSIRQRRIHQRIHPSDATGVHSFRFQWESELANGDEETELIFGPDGRLLGIDHRPPARDRRRPES